MHQSIKIPSLRHPGQTGEFNTDYNNTNNNNQETREDKGDREGIPHTHTIR